MSATVNPALKNVAQGILGHTDALKHLHTRDSAPAHSLKQAIGDALEGVSFGEDVNGDYGDDSNDDDDDDGGGGGGGGRVSPAQNGLNRLFPAGSNDNEPNDE